MRLSQFRTSKLLFIFVMLFTLKPSDSFAVPSFTRQTGMGCNACHTMFPELTPFGRMFKLTGYTMRTSPVVSVKESQQGSSVDPKQLDEVLTLLQTPPISAMIQASFSATNKKQPGTQNDNIDLPQQFSLFVAGGLTPRVGIFSQATYTQEDGKFSLDNVDLRYADSVGNIMYGVTVNNNPTVQDLWNTTPAWGYPYASSATGPSPAASTQLEGALSQRVAGVGGYFLYDQFLYGEASFYRSADQGASNPPDGNSTDTIQGVSPYWRLALQRTWGTHYLEVGTFGLVTNQYPKGVSGPTDKYADIGLDSQFEESTSIGTFVAHGSWIYERQNLDSLFSTGGASNSSDSLNSIKVDAGYRFLDHYGVSLGYFDKYGSTDSLLNASSANGKPNSDGFIAEVDYQPWLNTKIALQYTMYDKFNGSSTNYDGSGRSASDNNTLYLLGWVAF